jgi:hypothetical protein
MDVMNTYFRVPEVRFFPGVWVLFFNAYCVLVLIFSFPYDLFRPCRFVRSLPSLLPLHPALHHRNAS